MFIKKVEVRNFRNLRHVSVSLEKTTALIGANNSGKTNFMEAITLPLSVDMLRSIPKKLTIADINNDSKDIYYDFIKNHYTKIKNGDFNTKEEKQFKEVVPKVSVTLTFYYCEKESYLLKYLFSSLEKDNFVVSLQYNFKVDSYEDLFQNVQEVLINSESKDDLDDLKMNLLPIELYDYEIIVPNKLEKVNYNTLKHIQYNFISAQRDDFSENNRRLGNRSLVKILNSSLDKSDKICLERDYHSFFSKVKERTNMDDFFNFQNLDNFGNVKNFFENIDIVPNMPDLNNILNSVKLSYSESDLADQGLGYRNLIYQFMMIQALMREDMRESLYSLLLIEEPEAHVSLDNQLMTKSLITSIQKSNEEGFQFIYSTHEINLLNKLDLGNVIVFYEGKAISLSDKLSSTDIRYLINNPNTDLFKIFLLKRVVMVEGQTEEYFIRSLLYKNSFYLNPIEVITFHKGFRKIMKIWCEIYDGSDYRLGIVRDFDNEPKAKRHHEDIASQCSNIKVTTTSKYTLEDEIIDTKNNYQILLKYFNKKYRWSKQLSSVELSTKWKDSKTAIMMDFCDDFVSGDEILKNFEVPMHIKEILNFLREGNF